MRALARLPRPLALLLGVVAVFGVCWALLVPAWQAPDSSLHFAYAQSLAERLALPGSGSVREDSSEQSAADQAVGATRLSYNVGAVLPSWSGRTAARFSTRAPARSDGGGPNAEATNPPLYYLWADLAYWATYPAGIFGRLYAMALWGVVLLLATVMGAWLLAGELLGPRRTAQLACAAVAGLMPMETFISTSITPDALMVPLWTFALWTGSRVIGRAAETRDCVALCALSAAAILTKATSYALLPAVLLALVIGMLRRPAGARRRHLRAVALSLLALVLPLAGWIAYAKLTGRQVANSVGTPPGARSLARPFNVRQFLSYVWQFYLPRLPGMTYFSTTPQLSLFSTWIKEGWGVFGWIDVGLPGWIYGWLAGISAAIALGAAALVVRIRTRKRLGQLLFLALVLLGLLGGLHLTEYRSIIAAEGPLLQGRYLLPVVSLLGLALGTIVARVPVRVRGPLCGAILAGLLILQLLALGTVARTYYT